MYDGLKFKNISNLKIFDPGLFWNETPFDYTKLALKLFLNFKLGIIHHSR